MWSVDFNRSDSDKWQTGYLIALFCAAILLVSGIVAGVGGATLGQSDTSIERSVASDDRSSGNVSTADENGTGVSTTEITLVTGDTVVVENQSNGTDYRLKGDKPALNYETRTGAYVIPASVNTTRFSKELFNVELLRSQNQTDAETNEIPLIVEWRNATSMRRGVRPRSRVDVSRKRLLEMMNGSAVSVSKENASAVYRFLAGSDAVKSVHFNARFQGTAISPRENINAELARQTFNVTGEGVTVAVIDSGVNESHPDIGKDEIEEVNFVQRGSAGDVLNHGTPIAGIITGDGTAANGSYAGVAPEANVLDVRVLGRGNNATEDTLIKGIDYAIQQDVDIISMSIGDRAYAIRQSDPFYRQITRAAENNITVVASVGNVPNDPGNKVMTPGIHKDVITVGSSVNNTRVARSSRRGPTPYGRFVKPDLVAPGTNVRGPSAIPGEYVSKDGTSYATPFVSGATALLEERHPQWSNERVKNVVTSTADPLGPQTVYRQGSGNLNVSAALTPGIVVDPATIDFGFVPANSTVSRSVTVRNLGTETRHVNVSASAVAIRSGKAGIVSTNRSSLTLAPDESATLKLRVQPTDVSNQPYSGRLRVGHATAIFGYTPYRTVTVQKRELGQSSLDRISLVQTATGRVFEPDRNFEQIPLDRFDSQKTFYVPDSGEYTAVSVGRYRGQPIVTTNSTTVDSGVTTLTLDESQTVRQTINTASLPQTGTELHNRTVAVNPTIDGVPIDRPIVATNPSSAAIRVSPSSALTHRVRRILTADPHPEGSYNTSTIYHLEHAATDLSGNGAVNVDSSDLHRQRVRYYRGDPEETYSATLGAIGFRSTAEASYKEGGIGSTYNQSIYVSPRIVQYHDAVRFGSEGAYEWFASARWEDGYIEFDNSTPAVTAIKKQPYRSKVDTWSLTEQAFNATVFPTVGQPPNGYAIRDDPQESYELWVNGEHVESYTNNWLRTSVPDIPAGIESVRWQIQDRHGMSPLSNNTVTTFAATTNSSDTRPPTVPNLAFESHGKTNVIPNGSVDVTVSTTDHSGSVRNASLYVATRDSDGVPATTPFANATGWERVSLNETGDGTFETNLELGAYRGTLSVALKAVDDAGNYVETTATDGVVVGSRTPTADVATNRTLVERGQTVQFDASESSDDLGISTYEWDFDGDGTVDSATSGPIVTHQYNQTGLVRPVLTVTDPHDFDNTTRSTSIAVAAELPPRADDLDNRTTVDLKQAVGSGQLQAESGRLNGEQELASNTTLIARGDVNGGIEGDDGSTAVVDGGHVNGDTDGHNVIGADARFNGGVEADGTVTAARGAVTARGGLQADEAVRVLPNATLTVRGELQAETVAVQQNGSLVVHGQAEVDRFVARNGSTVQIDGRIDCDESQVEASVAIQVRGESDCDGVDATGRDGQAIGHDSKPADDEIEPGRPINGTDVTGSGNASRNSTGDGIEAESGVDGGDTAVHSTDDSITEHGEGEDGRNEAANKSDVESVHNNASPSNGSDAGSMEAIEQDARTETDEESTSDSIAAPNETVDGLNGSISKEDSRLTDTGTVDRNTTASS